MELKYTKSLLATIELLYFSNCIQALVIQFRQVPGFIS